MHFSDYYSFGQSLTGAYSAIHGNASTLTLVFETGFSPPNLQTILSLLPSLNVGLAAYSALLITQTDALSTNLNEVLSRYGIVQATSLIEVSKPPEQGLGKGPCL